MSEIKKLTISKISDYFGLITNLVELNNVLSTKLLSYTGRKYPLVICLSSNFENGTLLGTLNFLELDIDGYPIYTGNVIKSSSIDMAPITYLAGLSHYIGTGRFNSIWIIRLGAENQEDIIIKSSTTSLNPTSVDYEGIRRLTAGSCGTI